MKKFFFLIALFAALIPAAFTIYLVGGISNWQGVTPKGSTDSLYYYARIKEVTDGYPLVGNPYIYEHREAFSPAFFVPDIISALPLLIGMPFNTAIILNMFIWSFVFLFLSFILLKLLALPKLWSAASSLLMLVTSYSFMIRPTVMQIVYPAFLLFLILYFKFLQDPLSRRRGLWLALASAATFYIYSYLSYFVFFAYAFAFIWFAIRKRFEELRALSFSGSLVAVLLIPFAIITSIQMGDPYYFETLSRIGLTHTRIPSYETLFFARWVLLGILVTWLTTRNIFWIITGLSFLAVLYLNVATGIELTLAVHTGRFITLWLSMIILSLIYQWFIELRSENDLKKYFIAGLIILMVVGVAKNIPRGLSFFQYNNRGDDIADIQSYAGPLNWLNENAGEGSVVWANESISEYIPIMTKHYTLFHHSAALHSISGEELKDRYLLSRSLGTTSVEILKKDLGYYAGAGPLKYQAQALNRKAHLCESLSPLINKNCPEKINSFVLLGEEYFENLNKRFQEIKRDQRNMLDKYGVKYLVIDRERESVPITHNQALYDDGRFLIFALPL